MKVFLVIALVVLLALTGCGPAADAPAQGVSAPLQADPVDQATEDFIAENEEIVLGEML